MGGPFGRRRGAGAFGLRIDNLAHAVVSAGTGDRVLGGGGGARLVYSASLNRPVYEAGISSVSGTGSYPTGASVFQAARRAKADAGGSYIIRIYGAVSGVLSSPSYATVGSWHWFSRVVNKRDVLLDLYPIRFGDGGNGSAESQDHLGWDTSPSFHSTFLRILSEISGFGWDVIETVQFFP